MTYRRYVDFGVPFNACNLNCHYCYVQQREDKRGRGHVSDTHLKYSIEHIVKALSVERLEGVCIINLCAAGETLLPPYISELITSFLKEGHYVTIVTNGTLTEKFNEISLFDTDLLERLFFKFSFHFLELKRTNLMDTFFRNIQLVKKMGASFSVEFCAADELEPFIDEIMGVCMKNIGAYPHLVMPRVDDTKNLLSKHTLEEFVEIWRIFDSALFDFKVTYWGEKRTEFCRSGEYMFLINGGNGNYSKCYKQGVMQNIFENITQPIIFEPVGHDCKMPHCFNSHFFLTTGCIDEIHDVSYTDIRDRVDANTGEHWLNPIMRELFSHRFADYDKERKTDDTL